MVVPAAPPPIPEARPAVDVGGTLRAVAKQRLSEVVAKTPPTEIPAFGPCTRPDAAAQAKLRTRIEAWLRVHWPAREAEEPPVLTYGCVDRGGAIVDIAVDTFEKGKARQANKGHWLTVRVADQISIAVEADGIPSTWGGEWAISTTQNTLALADLDRDGVFDVLSVKQLHEGGAMTNDLTLTTVLSTGARHTTGEFGDSVELAAFEANVVLIVRDPRDQEERVIVRCVDRTGTLVRTCPEAARVQRAVDTQREAKRIVELPPEANFDRDEVAELAALFQLGERERTELVAASTPDPASVVMREVMRFTAEERGASQLTYERAKMRADELALLSAAALKALDETECSKGEATPALVARVRAIIAAGERRAIVKAAAADESIKFQCAKGCTWGAPSPAVVTAPCVAGTKRYLIADWRTKAGEVEVLRKALLFADGDRVVPIVDGAKLVGGNPWGEAVELDPRFYRRGEMVNATALVALEHPMRSVVVANDGVVIDRRKGEFRHYGIKPLIAEQSELGLGVWHAGKRLATINSENTAPSAVVALAQRYESRIATRSALVYFNYDLSDDDSRASLIKELSILDAPATLIERVRAVR